MILLQDAWKSLKLNQAILFSYMGIVVAFSIAYSLVDRFVFDAFPEGETPLWVPVYQLFMALVHAGFAAALQAICFARLGRDIDRPLWKCESDTEALRRFFEPWFLLNLVLVMLVHLAVRAQASGDESLWAGLQTIFMLFFVVTIPIGACIMYHGKLVWPELPEALRPMLYQMPHTLTVILVLLLEFVLISVNASVFQSLQSPTKYFYLPITDVPVAFLDCLAFAAMWRVCMIQRDAGTEDQDPFEF